ncbi:hypothetical protein [Saccharothrix australiensis]|uniref:Adhesin n=1 Tax=Saccharothrix australiensis TaxID=2072 RepID=A0A495W0I3_9PSEU|nr:hypothetical protein [Saccharothrix australiensis]RKT54263.1 hypothetical protein C8E97_2879 [Saccharothrix australiensis]
MPAFATPEPITATLTTAGARVRVVATDQTDTVVLVEPVNKADKSDLKAAEHTKVDFADGELTVKMTKSGGRTASVAITVELPVASRLVLHTAWSDVDAEGPLGDCRLAVSSGQVRLDRVATLRGHLAAGVVEVGHVAGAVELDGGAAAVTIGEVEGIVRYHGSTGEVRIGHAFADVAFTSSSGGLDIGRAEGSVHADAADCPIRIGRLSRGQAELRNASGGIAVGVSAGTAVDVDAESTKGAVHDSVSAWSDPSPSTERVKVHARTRLDDIVLHRTTV